MKKIELSGLKVSEACLGAMNFGTSTSEENSFAVLDAFVERGGNFIDTSNNYAHWLGTGDESKLRSANGFVVEAAETNWSLPRKWASIATAKGRVLKKNR